MNKHATLERIFHLHERGSTVRTEFLAGFTIFLSCASVLVLTPSILSAAGMDTKAVFYATAISVFIACTLMGIYVNRPIALGPSIGLASFLSFYVVKTLGMLASGQRKKISPVVIILSILFIFYLVCNAIL